MTCDRKPLTLVVGSTLRGTKISHLGKRNKILKSALTGDMLVPGRVILCETSLNKGGGGFHSLSEENKPWPSGDFGYF